MMEDMVFGDAIKAVILNKDINKARSCAKSVIISSSVLLVPRCKKKVSNDIYFLKLCKYINIYVKFRQLK